MSQHVDEQISARPRSSQRRQLAGAATPGGPRLRRTLSLAREGTSASRGGALLGAARCARLPALGCRATSHASARTASIQVFVFCPTRRGSHCLTSRTNMCCDWCTRACRTNSHSNSQIREFHCLLGTTRLRRLFALSEHVSAWWQALYRLRGGARRPGDELWLEVPPYAASCHGASLTCSVACCSWVIGTAAERDHERNLRGASPPSPRTPGRWDGAPPVRHAFAADPASSRCPWPSSGRGPACRHQWRGAVPM